MERYIAVDNVCAWPNLTLMPDGTIVATIFNQPTHGGWEGDVDCWASADGVGFWSFRGRPAPHEPRTNRMNVAAGLGRGGDMIVLASGWSNRNPVGQYSNAHEGVVIDPWVCRSGDSAKTWTHTSGAVALPGKHPHPLIPFGDIIYNHDGTLGVSFYGWGDDPKNRESLFYVSQDDGKTWRMRSRIGADYNETTLLALPDGRLLAAARSAIDQHLNLFRSDDAGKTWVNQEPLSLPGQIPGHLIRLGNGNILASYGIRNRGCRAIGARLSEDGGHTWKWPMILVILEGGDMGYPSCVQLADGTIVTAYYCKSVPNHNRYHMGVLRWKLEEMTLAQS